MDKKRRTFTFGKHKGEFILEIIRTQPWYIEWLLENVAWFKLNDEESAYYNQTCADWREAWNNVRYAFKRGEGAAKEMYKTVESYKKGEIKPMPEPHYADILSGIQNQFSKYIDEYDDFDEIYPGNDPMSLF